jgi:hypothetical protein
MKKLFKTSLLSSLVLAGFTAHASLWTFVVPLDGSQEFPGPGDPDGSGLATLVFDDVALSLSWNISVADIALPVAAAHIHLGPFGASGPVKIDFDGMLSGTTFDSDVALVLANPDDYYVNVHNAEYRAGAVRGQIPAEPTPVPEASTGVAGMALALLLIGQRSIRRCRTSR